MARDRQTSASDVVEYTYPGFRAVSRHYDNLDQRTFSLFSVLVKCEKRFNKRHAGPVGQILIFVTECVFAIFGYGCHSILCKSPLKDAVSFRQVK